MDDLTTSEEKLAAPELLACRRDLDLTDDGQLIGAEQCFHERPLRYDKSVLPSLASEAAETRALAASQSALRHLQKRGSTAGHKNFGELPHLL